MKILGKEVKLSQYTKFKLWLWSAFMLGLFLGWYGTYFDL